MPVIDNSKVVCTCGHSLKSHSAHSGNKCNILGCECYLSRSFVVETWLSLKISRLEQVIRGYQRAMHANLFHAGDMDSCEVCQEELARAFSDRIEENL